MDAVAYNVRRAHEIRALSALGWLPPELRGGDPGAPLWASAVAAWQREHGLTPDGACGPATWAALKRLAHPEWAPIPHGRAAVLALHGDPQLRRDASGRFKVDAAWRKASIAPVSLGFTKQVLFARCRAEEFALLMATAVRISGYQPESVQTFVPRFKRGPRGVAVGNPSMHTFAAFDVDPPLNPWGNKAWSPVVKHPLFAAVFRVAGWSCGCDWRDPDTMHFQAMTGW